MTELTSLIKAHERKTKIAKLSALVLIVGLAGELISGPKISSVTDQITAILKNEAEDARRDANLAKAQSDSFQRDIADSNARAKAAEAQVASANAASRDAVAKVANSEARIAEANRAAADANARAAEAKQTAEAERLERVKLEQRVDDRQVTQGQHTHMLEILRSKKGTTVIVDPIISRALRRVCREAVREVLCGQVRASVADAGDLLSGAADRVFRRHRGGARDRVAASGFAGAAAFCGHCAGRVHAGSLDDLADPAIDRFGHASRSVRLGAGRAGRSGTAESSANRD